MISPNTISNFQDDDSLVLGWLKNAGFSYDPFVALESSRDPNLSSYLIEHKAFETAWGTQHSIIFAPGGGGKTAMRGRIAQACWVGQEPNRPFPVDYIPPFTQWDDLSPTLDNHLSVIVKSCAEHLLLALACRPHWFLRLDDRQQQFIKQNLAWNLPGRIETFLAPCREQANIAPLTRRFSPISVPADPPNPHMLSEYLDALEAIKVSNSGKPNVFERWEQMQEVLLDVIKSPGIFLLVDGLDATFDTLNAPEKLAPFLGELLNDTNKWTGKNVFLKIFAPLESESTFNNVFPGFIKQSLVSTITWTPSLLAEMIRRRVYAASEGLYGSLSPLAIPDIREPEILVAKAVDPLPREMLIAIRRLILEASRHADSSPKINAEDVRTALAWYAENRTIAVVQKAYIGGGDII